MDLTVCPRQTAMICSLLQTETYKTYANILLTHGIIML